MAFAGENPGNQERVKALVFDAYGTLFDLESLAELCEEAFPGHGQEFCQVWRAKQLEYSHLLTMMGRYEDFWAVTGKALQFACKSLKLDCRPAVQERLQDRYFYLEVFPDVPPALQALSCYPLTILSNGSPKMLQVAVRHAGLENFFTHLISASEVQRYKPHPQVYEWAAKRMGLAPESLGLVSANAWDVMGAQASGLWACWVNRAAAPWDELGFTPDAEVSQMTDLPVLLA